MQQGVDAMAVRKGEWTVIDEAQAQHRQATWPRRLLEHLRELVG